MMMNPRGDTREYRLVRMSRVPSYVSASSRRSARRRGPSVAATALGRDSLKYPGMNPIERGSGERVKSRERVKSGGVKLSGGE